MVEELFPEAEVEGLPENYFQAIRLLVDAGRTSGEIVGLVRLFCGLEDAVGRFDSIEGLIERTERVANVIGGDVDYWKDQAKLRKRVHDAARLKKRVQGRKNKS